MINYYGRSFAGWRLLQRTIRRRRRTYTAAGFTEKSNFFKNKSVHVGTAVYKPHHGVVYTAAVVQQSAKVRQTSCGQTRVNQRIRVHKQRQILKSQFK